MSESKSPFWVSYRLLFYSCLLISVNQPVFLLTDRYNAPRTLPQSSLAIVQSITTIPTKQLVI